jgi:outer membrane biosynthesis protein TonB
VTTKRYALVALTVAAIWLSPARAQSNAEWLACMDLWADEAFCEPLLPTPPPPPPVEEPPPPPPVEEPPPPPPPPPPVEEPPPPPPVEEPPPPPPVEEPPPPPPPPAADACAKGNQHGFGLSHSRGNAKGHCESGDRHAKKHKHARRHDHRAKAKALLSQLARWCKALAHGGRHA